MVLRLNEGKVALHCRIGSSEKLRNSLKGIFILHCRIGSSEKAAQGEMRIT